MNISNRQPFMVAMPMIGAMFFIGIVILTPIFGGRGMSFFWVFPLFGFGVMFVMMLVVRYFIFGQRHSSFRSSQSHTRMRRTGRGGHCGHTSFEEIEEMSAPAPFPAQYRQQSRPVKQVAAREHLVDASFRGHLKKARTYQEQINSLIKSESSQYIRARLQALTSQVNEWVRAIESLSKSISKFQQNTLIQQDLKSVPQSIKKVEAQLAEETDESTRNELERTLANYKNQLAALEKLQSIINRADIKMESTLSALGTVYSQVLTAQSTNRVADYSRLLAEADEEVRTLQDYLEALEEVKLGKELL